MTTDHQELVRRAAGLAPLIRAQAATMEQDRRLSDEVVSALTDSGLLRMRVPVQYGGYESDLRTVQAVAVELGRADLSTAWVVAVYATNAGLVAKFPEAVQREVFAAPDAKIGAVLSPTGTATAAPGGVRVKGSWSFASGAWHSDWAQLTAIGTEPLALLVPMADLTRVDDWHTSGLRASGSITLTADDIFVPEHRVTALGPLLQARPDGKPAYRTHSLGAAVIAMTAPLIGGLQAALDAFLERLPGRPIMFTAYPKQAEAPVTHLQLGEVTMLLDEARFHAERAAGAADAKAESGAAWSIVERARLRADAGRVAELVRRAAQVIGSAGGGSSIRLELPLRRVLSDLEAISLHALYQPASTAELYGRVLAGLEPNTPFL